MAFTPPSAQVPTTVQRITVMLTDALATEEEPARQSARYQLLLLDQDGQPIRFRAEAGNLVPHLTQNQITQLQAFMASLRALAEGQLLG